MNTDAFKRVFVGADPKACWPWPYGSYIYGKVRIRGIKERQTHRVAYTLFIGAIPSGAMVLHKCNNKLCCNPDHLIVGTNSDNQFHRAFIPGILRGVSYERSRDTYTATYGDTQAFFRHILYKGKDFFEACCARKSWEAQQQFFARDVSL